MVEIKHLLHIKAPVSKVYQAVTEVEGLKSWWTGGTSGLSEIGSRLTFDFDEKYHNEMKVLEQNLNKYVEWVCLEGDHEWIGTKFFFEFEASGNEAILRFSHSNWKEQTDFFASCNYHWGFYLRSLKLYCDTGKGTPFPQD